MGVRCFLIERTDRQRRYLRRYHSSADEKCEVSGTGYHNARCRIEDDHENLTEDGLVKAIPEFEYLHDERWPTHCACGREFTPDDRWQVFTETIWHDGLGGEWVLPEAPAGAMWDSTWLPWKGPDGRSLVVKLPGGEHDWWIDGPATNCGKGEPHQCWCRHGQPPLITVNKDPEPGQSTCDGGGGSIQVEGYHGHLTNGEFT